MPNWCKNIAYFSHPDKKKIQDLRKATEKEALLEHIFPQPAHQSLQNVTNPETRSQYEKENIQSFGYKNIIDWQYHIRGTKWDIVDVEVHRIYKRQGTYTFKASYDTAWGIPVETYDEMVNRGYNVKVFYEEPLMCFCGKYTNKYNDHYSLDPEDSGWETSDVPKNILKTLGLIDE